MKTFELFGWHLLLGRKAANAKTKVIIVEGMEDEKPKTHGKCPECEKVVFPLIQANETIPLTGKVEYRLANNWAQTGNILLRLNCPHCNWAGEGWFTLVEVR